MSVFFWIVLAFCLKLFGLFFRYELLSFGGFLWVLILNFSLSHFNQCCCSQVFLGEPEKIDVIHESVFSLSSYIGQTFQFNLIMSNPSRLPALPQGKFRRNVPSFGFLNHITQSAVVTAALDKQEIWKAFTFTAMISIIVEGWMPSPNIYPSAQHATSLSFAYICNLFSFVSLISLTIQAIIYVSDATYWAKLLFQGIVGRKGLTNCTYMVYGKLLETYSSVGKNIFCSCKWTSSLVAYFTYSCTVKSF